METGAPRDPALRLAAFSWLRTQVEKYGDVLPYRLLNAGFEHNGRRISLMNQPGIWRPRGFEVQGDGEKYCAINLRITCQFGRICVYVLRVSISYVAL